MPEIGALWKSISDAWMLMDRRDRRQIEALWAGYQEIVAQYLIQLNRAGLDNLVEYAVPHQVDLWEKFDCTGSGLIFPIEEDIVRIPQLQDRIDSPTTTLTEGTDYTVANHRLVFDAAPDAALWAPKLYRENPSVHEVLGEPVNLHLDQVGWSSEDALRALRCIWYCYQHGPTLENVRASVNALMGLPYASYPGRVTAVTHTTLTLRFGDSGRVYPGNGGVGYVGREIVTRLTGTPDSTRRLVLVDDLGDIEVGDWWLVTGGDQAGDYQVRQLHDVAASTRIDTTEEGETDSTGHWFQGAGADWSQVEPGDILEITSPASMAGSYPVDMIDPTYSKAYFRTPLRPHQTSLQYKVVRKAWMQVDQSLPEDEVATGRVVRTLPDWPENIWSGCMLVDAAGSEHTIWGNGPSTLRTTADVEVGAFRIRPRFVGVDADYETHERIAQSAATVAMGDYVRRFQPLLDGVRIHDWRSDARWKRWQPPLVMLSQDTDGTATIKVASVEGIYQDAIYHLMAEGMESVEVVVDSVTPPDTLTLTQAAPTGYTTAQMARLVPTRLSVEGHTGFFIITEPSPTGATSGDGLQLTDNEADFLSESILSGDTVRLIDTDGQVYSALIGSVIDAHNLTVSPALPINLTDVYYQIVRPYTPSYYATLRVNATAYLEGLLDEGMIEDSLEWFLPNHVRFYLTSSVVELMEALIPIEEAETFLIFIGVEPTGTYSIVDGDDSVDDAFTVGPWVPVWLEEAFTELEGVVPIYFEALEPDGIGSEVDRDDNLDDAFIVGPAYHPFIDKDEASVLIFGAEDPYVFPSPFPPPGSVVDGDLNVDQEFTAGPFVDEWETEMS